MLGRQTRCSGDSLLSLHIELGRIFEMNRDLAQMIGIGFATLVTMVLGKLFPLLSGTIWAVFLTGIATLLYRELRKPVNYHSIDFSEQGFVFSRYAGMPESARWDEITDVYFIRSLEPFINDMETEWLIYLSDGKVIAVLVEFPHRRKFARELERHVQKFDKNAARTALASWKEGRWHCFQEPNQTFQPTPSARLN